METIGRTGPWVIDESVAWVHHDDRDVLVKLAPPFTALPTRLDATGAILWSAIAQGETLDELVTNFEGDPDEVRRGIIDFVTNVLAQGLIGPADRS